MFNIYSINYMSLSKEKARDFFILRRKTFSDRLGWSVTSTDGLEKDKFDNKFTDYILGVMEGKIICGTRLIAMSNKNMLESIFSEFFKDVKIPPGNYVESTRFFVDKKRARNLPGHKHPVTMALFLSIINFAQQRHYDGVIAVASQAMMHIIRKSGWHMTVLKTGRSEKNEPVYLLLGHVDDDSRKRLKENIIAGNNIYIHRSLDSWPIAVNSI